MALDLTIFLMAQNVVFEQSHIPNHSTLKSGAAAFPIFAFRDEGSMRLRPSTTNASGSIRAGRATRP
ncbi:hypothetical protein [Sphingomonas sp. Ant H11]|uniref:hypothetical protein n=1 Tax=Sphingomonas sp. Ant H11 TaxID=1564113 RepID=UPI001E380631|nr:hypothetical protein [Sphingomonas sp. Ant H11]